MSASQKVITVIDKLPTDLIKLPQYEVARPSDVSPCQPPSLPVEPFDGNILLAKEVIESDHGAEMQSRTWHQAAVAAIYALDMTHANRLAKLFCELVEDILILTDDNKLLAIQVKTKEHSRGTFTLTESDIKEVLKRYFDYELNSPGQFWRFVVATNVPFKDQKTEQLNVYIETAMKPSETTIAKEEYFCRLINYEYAHQNRASINTAVRSVLEKTILNVPIPALRDERLYVSRSLSLFIGDSATSRQLNDVAEYFISAMTAAGSRARESISHGLQVLADSPDQATLEIRLKGKAFTPDDIRKMLDEGLTRARAVSRAEDQVKSEINSAPTPNAPHSGNSQFKYADSKDDMFRRNYDWTSSSSSNVRNPPASTSQSTALIGCANDLMQKIDSAIRSWDYDTANNHAKALEQLIPLIGRMSSNTGKDVFTTLARVEMINVELIQKKGIKPDLTRVEYFLKEAENATQERQ